MDYCNCYREDKRCNGTKEIDHCSCGGDESMCDFYDYTRDRVQENINKCRYNSNDGQDICCNADCPYCADFCPVLDYPEVCVFRETIGR